MIADIKLSMCLSQAARQWLPPSRTGNPIHPSVLSRWAKRGIIADDGTRVFLKTWRVGGQIMTNQANVEDFLSALNAGSPTSDYFDDENQMGRRANEACAALEKLGC